MKNILKRKLKPFKPLIDRISKKLKPIKEKLEKLKKKLEPYKDLIDQIKKELVKKFKELLKSLPVPEFFLEFVRSIDPVSTQTCDSLLLIIKFVSSALSKT